MFLTAVPLAFSLLHLLLFLFYPRAKENLYYAAFVFFIAGQNLFNYYPDSFPYLIVLRFLSILVVIFGLLFLYSIVYSKRPKQFTYFLLGSFGIGVWILINPDIIDSPIYYVYSLVFMLEFFRIIIWAVLKKIEGFWIIGIGALILGFIAAYEMFMDIVGFTPIFGISDPGVYATMAFFISMSAYLAWKFARTNTALEKRSEELQNLNIELEDRVAQRTKELAKANESLEKQNIELADSRNELQISHINLLKAHDELRQTQTRLVQSEKMASLGSLAAGIAHEINTPVGAVHSAADTSQRSLEKIINTIDESENIEDIKKGEKFWKSLDILKSNNNVIVLASVRIAKIVQSLRNFARLDEAEFQEADVHEGINSTLTLVHHRIKDRIKVVKRFGDIPKIQCSPNQINQVFMNILNNAAQAIREQGVITIKTARVNDKVLISFADDGEGIKKDHLTKIFDPGFTTRGVGIGMGLGLSISYNIIKDHKGEIKVKSEEGQGAEFTVILPMDHTANPT